MKSFPHGFLWGTATSSHQVEGNNRNNQWFVWEQMPGRIWGGDVAGAACDWWQNAERDFDLMVTLHQNAHRLSLEWSRIEPEEGIFDSSALDRYRQMLQNLRDRGIEPMVTLHHFTEPLWFWERGSWRHPQALDYFRRYVARVVAALGDLVHLWCTINEPAIYATLGYLRGEHPPGAHNPVWALQVLRRLLQAHATAYRVIHGLQSHAQVGIVKSVAIFAPWRPESALDRGAARRVDYLFNVLPLEAVDDGLLRPPLGLGLAPYGPLVDSADFIGLNYYTRYMVAFDPAAPLEFCATTFVHPGGTWSDMTRDGTPYGEIYPEGIYQALRWLWRRFRKPIYITENGLPDHDDDQRPGFILNHLVQVHRAIAEGIDVRGYFHWTLVDNFEWAEGWHLRFGLVALDPETQERTLRPSAHLYADICQHNGIRDDLLQP